MSVLPIENLEKGVGGGKAHGLSLLHSYDVNIPLTFVITEVGSLATEKLLDSLPKGIKLAVRSSADGEDGTALSFAGQYSTYLNIETKEEVTSAIEKCFASQKQETVKSYKENLGTNGFSGMNVIVQEMVDTKASGVLFTANPVNNRFDKLSLTITKGIGEKLMLGQLDGEQFDFYKHSEELPESKIISKEVFELIVKQSKEIEIKFGQPVDLEWAVDNENRLWWLQLRPITKLEQVHLNELDYHPLYENPIYTRGNIGEMMPGPVTPLTLSTFAKAIDVGLQVFYKKTASIKAMSDDMLFIHSYYNHLFFDMNRLYEIVKSVSLSKKENIDYTIVGKLVPSHNVETEVNFVKAGINFISMVNYLNSAPKAWKKLKALHANFNLPCPENTEDCYKLISENLHILNKAYSLHYVTSSQSGGLYSAILNIFSGGKLPTIEHQKKANALFSDIPNIESAEVIKLLDKISLIIKDNPLAQKLFVDVSLEESLNYLETTAPTKTRKAWSEFIKRHGHRGVREAEMFEKEWALNPMPIVGSIRVKTALLINGGSINGKKYFTVDKRIEGLSFLKKMIVKQILPKARKAVARREQTKAWSIGIQNNFKQAYRHLAKQLVNNGLLDDEEQIFFLEHREIGKLIKSSRTNYWKSICNSRRDIYLEMQKLSFDDLYFGIPVPQEETKNEQHGDLFGIPVSHGEVTAKVRIVKSIADAAKLKEGEIMVAQFTDVGWSPYYGIISGLITEIGSPLSHGAVVAREYGLPTIVSMKGATSLLKTGQTIKLDAFNGNAELIEELIEQIV